MLRNSVLDDKKFRQAISSRSDTGTPVFQFLLWTILWLVLVALIALS